MLDGDLAEATGTKSPLGEVLESAADKALIAAALATLAYKRLIPAEVLVPVAAQNAASMAVSVAARWQGSVRFAATARACKLIYRKACN